MSASALYAAEDNEIVLPAIDVEALNSDISSEQSGEYKIENSRAATKLNLSVKDTPQTITVLTRQVIDDFGLDTLNDALDLMPSISVERGETDRTYYTSRGFSITNFQVDSLAIPNAFDYPLIQGDIDTVVYDRIETLRGANGMITGTGNPAATINYVRKRPTDEFQASINGSVGSWQKYRGEADVSGSLNDNGTIRGRFVSAYEDKESYLDRYEKQREVLYGVLDFELNDQTVLTVGHTYQKDNPSANLWGALPLTDVNGEQISYKTSDSNSQDWAYWVNKTNNSFIELKSELGNDWQTTAQLSRNETKSDSQLFYLWGVPDPSANNAVPYFANKYASETVSYIADAFASGPFELAGREHELMVGVQWAKSDQEDLSGDASIFTNTTLDDALAGNIAEPNFGAWVSQGEIEATQRSIYGSVKLNLTDNLKVITGARYIDYDIESTSFGANNEDEINEWIPYIGTVYSLTDNVNAYASFTQIFQPQSKLDRNLRLLEPAEGQTFEVGLKKEFNQKRALATVSLYKTEQNNLAESDIYIGPLQTYKGIDVESKGIELDVMGEVYPGLNVIGGYTYVDVEDKSGKRAKLYIPKQSFKLATTYELPFSSKWKVGANVRWQSAIENENENVSVKQGAYSVWGATTSYDVTPKLTAQLNVYNIFNEKYYTTFYNTDGQSYYSAPRSAVLSMDYKF
jgi:outer membrane receptor for ferric coprogen and ferric-rhodotorulic acid